MGGENISWVEWSTVCQTHDNGGLEVKDVRVMNLILLAKWRWRLIQSDQSLWKGVFICKYGTRINLLLRGNDNWPSNASRWWKDLVTLEDSLGSNWFNREVGRKVENGL